MTERKLELRYNPKQAGDVRDTYADITSAARDLGYRPSTSLEDGLRDEIGWIRRDAAPVG